MQKYIKRAFTLIELLVVIAIIGILSGLIVITMSGVTSKATIAKGQIFSNSLRNALMINLVSEWKMDEGSSATVADSWNGSNNCTWSGAGGGTYTSPSWRTSSECVNGSCLAFDGTDDYLNCGSGSNLSPGTGNFTIEVWFKTSRAATGSASANTLIGNKSTSYGYRSGYHISADGYLYFTIGDGTNSARVNSTTLLNDGKWHLGTVAFDKSGNGSIYVDGNFNISTPITSVGSIVGTYATSIGAGAGGAVLYFEGMIDTVRYYSEVLPVAGIKENYYSGINRMLAGGKISTNDYLEYLK